MSNWPWYLRGSVFLSGGNPGLGTPWKAGQEWKGRAVIRREKKKTYAATSVLESGLISILISSLFVRSSLSSNFMSSAGPGYQE